MNARGQTLTDPSRFQATLLGYVGECTSVTELRLRILDDLVRATGCDGALLRPGESWATSRAVYLDESSRFTDIYVANAARFGPELGRWCALSRGSEAFIDGDVYGQPDQQRMAAYREMIHSEGIRSILACPLPTGDSTAGLIFLFRRGSAARFPTETAVAATRLLPALALALRLVAAAFLRGRPTGTLRAAPSEVGFAELGPREQQVAALIARGLQTKEIAALLGSSFHTVHAQTRRIFDKLGLRGRLQVALLAQEIGLTQGACAAGGNPMLASFGALVCRSIARRFGDHPDESASSGANAASPPANDLPRSATLGARERQVAELVAQGMTSRAIAERTGTSFHTVRAQTKRIYEKLRVTGRTELALALSGGRNIADHPFE